MLRTSSVKAFVVSNLAQFFLSMAIGFPVTLLLWRSIGTPPITKASFTFGSAMMLTILPFCLSGVVASAIAGFIAGRMAEYRPVLHGALASGCLFLLTLNSALNSVLHPTSFGAQLNDLPLTIVSLIAAFAALLAGALGGYGAARLGGGASRHDVAPVSRTGFIERGLVVKFLAALIVTICICTFIFFSPTIFCHGGGAGGNCGEGYMASIPVAFVASPFIFAAALFVL
jgi:hypothetical protein